MFNVTREAVCGIYHSFSVEMTAIFIAVLLVITSAKTLNC